MSFQMRQKHEVNNTHLYIYTTTSGSIQNYFQNENLRTYQLTTQNISVGSTK